MFVQGKGIQMMSWKMQNKKNKFKLKNYEKKTSLTSPYFSQTDVLKRTFVGKRWRSIAIRVGRRTATRSATRLATRSPHRLLNCHEVFQDCLTACGKLTI
jgi:hypothetical protein